MITYGIVRYLSRQKNTVHELLKEKMNWDSEYFKSFLNGNEYLTLEEAKKVSRILNKTLTFFEDYE